MSFFQRAAEGGIAADARYAEWTYEGRTKSERLVVPDGIFTRYQGSMYCVHGVSGHIYANPGGTAEVLTGFCPCNAGAKVFLLFHQPSFARSAS